MAPNLPHLRELLLLLLCRISSLLPAQDSVQVKGHVDVNDPAGRYVRMTPVDTSADGIPDPACHRILNNSGFGSGSLPVGYDIHTGANEPSIN